MSKNKFKVWSISDGKWIYSFETGLSRFFAICDGEYSEKVDIESLSQFATEKDGSEIYEGDLIEITLDFRNDYAKSIWEVFYDIETACYNVRQSHKKDSLGRTEYIEKLDWYLEEEYKIEVVGHNYDKKITERGTNEQS